MKKKTKQVTKRTLWDNLSPDGKSWITAAAKNFGQLVRIDNLTLGEYWDEPRN
ncbi:MAG: hypothetical protein PF495_10060 [Spirochaetales bacterium]|jgi:hypothetical protein|nr:hypothetical protein [Spirochaetales bacterium]